jgi:hypothetical protein
MTESPAGVAGRDRRVAPRYSYDANLEIEWGSATLPGRVREISSGGMFIEMQDPLWLGARFAATWSLEDPLQIECEVRRVEPGRGIGVCYTIADSSARERVAALLERLGHQ